MRGKENYRIWVSEILILQFLPLIYSLQLNSKCLDVGQQKFKDIYLHSSPQNINYVQANGHIFWTFDIQ